MLDFLIDNLFVEFGRRVFQQTSGIQVGIICAPVFVDLFLLSFEADL